MFFDGMRGICFYLFGVFWTNKHVRWHERCNWYVGRWSDIFTAASCHQDMNLSWICVSSYPLYSCQHCPSPLWDLISYSVPSRSRQLSLNSKRFQCHHSHARNWSAQEQLATLPSCVRPHHLFFFFSAPLLALWWAHHFRDSPYFQVSSQTTCGEWVQMVGAEFVWITRDG